jgi:hypothetical protein
VNQFGLAAWILFDYSDGRRESDEAVRYMNALDLPSDLASTWRIAESATTHGRWNDLDWRSWELGVKDEGEAHFIEFNSYMYLAFLLQALRLIGRGDASLLPDSEDFKHLAAADGQLMRQLEEIERTTDKWKPFIDDAAIAAVPELRSRLQQASERAQEDERRSLIEAPIDDTKKAEVVRRVEVGWEEEGLLRKLAQEAKAYDFIDQEPPSDVLPFGLNQLDTKHAYVAETEVHTIDWGQEWGRSLARGENEAVMGVLQSRPPLLENGVPSMARKTEAALDRLSNGGLQPVVLINRSWKAGSSIEKAPGFEWPKDRHDPDLVGRFHKRPVYNLHVQGPEEVVVVDIAAAIRWKQFRPPTLSEDQDVIREVISIAIEAFDEDRAQGLIDEWTDEGRQIDWTIETLRERVGLRTFERFRIEMVDQEAGLRLPAALVTDEEEES